MDITLWLELGAFVVLMGLSGFFSSSETSLFSLDSVRLEQMRQDNNPSIGLIERLLNEPRRLIVTILIGNELVNVAASVISAAVVIRVFGPENKWLNLFIMVPILLLIGEITPKTLAIRNNVKFATLQAKPIQMFATAITPLRWIIRHVSDFFITMVVGSERSAANIITEDMVRSLAQEAVGEGALDNQEVHFINQIFDFGDLTVGDVMTPRSDMFSLSATLSLAEMATQIALTRHTKVPVYEADRETIAGVLFARDLLGMDLTSETATVVNRRTLTRSLRKAYFVPESKLAAELFHTFRNRKLSLALTVDEFGGVTGLVSMEDLLECIFGDIRSVSEIVREKQVSWEKLEGGRFQVEGAMTVRQLNDILGSAFSDDDAETAGGLALNAFGELPPEGASVTVDDWTFTVASVTGHRIDDLIVARTADAGRPIRADAEAATPQVDPSAGEA